MSIGSENETIIMYTDLLGINNVLSNITDSTITNNSINTIAGYNLTAIFIGTNITQISDNAFINFPNLATITFTAPISITLNVKAFVGINNSAIFNFTNYANYTDLPLNVQSFITNMKEINSSYTFTPAPIVTIISNVCFQAGTIIITDQGYINIEKIDIEINTIRGKRILGISKTILTSDYVILIKKNALNLNVPNVDTIVSKDHKILFKSNMYRAEELMLIVNNIIKIKYNGNSMYNVILEKYDYMIANNLIVETLHPINPICKLFTNKLIIK